MKKGILFVVLGCFLLFSPNVYAEESKLSIIVEAPVEWAKVTLEFPFQVLGSLFGLEGDPALNDNYAGMDGKFGYYESFSDESYYRYQRWGVN